MSESNDIIQAMKLPIRILKSPIIEAVTELRFENEQPSAVVFGKLYSVLSEEFPQTEQLPILQIPPDLLENQKQLRYAPHYRLVNGNFMVGIGQRVISVNRICLEDEYSGWDDYYKVIQKVVNKVQTLQIADDLKRVSVRYINYFDVSIEDALNLKVDLFGENVTSSKPLLLNFRHELANDMKLNVVINTTAQVQFKEQKKEGLVLNIEAYKKEAVDIVQVDELTIELHDEVKKTFFGSLKPNYLKKLEPIYG